MALGDEVLGTIPLGTGVSKIKELALATYAEGSQSFTKLTPNGLRGFVVALGRKSSADATIWPDPATKIRLVVECSYDGGQSFPAAGGRAEGEWSGGTMLDRNGLELPETLFHCNFDPPPNAVRVTVQMIGGSIKTFADVTVL